MNNICFDIPFFLTSLTLLLGLLIVLDRFYLKKDKWNRPWYIEQAYSLFPVFLLVLLIRSFLVQPYRVPSGSLMPTIMPGDFILVEQYRYGLRLPVLNTKICPLGTPKRGDLVLFRYPPDPSRVFIKRMVGLPGDHVVYRDGELLVNGKVMEQKVVGRTLDISSHPVVPVTLKLEDLDGVEHAIYLKDYSLVPDVDCIVPAGSYFVVGDNRDSSNDSRMWGMVPEENLIGRAFIIWFSWDNEHHKVRFKRIGRNLYRTPSFDL